MSSSSRGIAACPGPLVAILPGSRTQEVTHNLRWFLKAAVLIRQQVPDVRFALASFKPQQAEIARKIIAAAQGGQSHFRGGEADSRDGVELAAKIGTVPAALPSKSAWAKRPN